MRPLTASAGKGHVGEIVALVSDELLAPTPAPPSGGPLIAPVTDSAATSSSHHVLCAIGARRCAVAIPGNRSPESQLVSRRSPQQMHVLLPNELPRDDIVRQRLQRHIPGDTPLVEALGNTR